MEGAARVGATSGAGTASGRTARGRAGRWGWRLALSGSLVTATLVPAVLLSVPAAVASTPLYSQVDFPGPFGIHSNTNYFGSQAADDFVVPSGTRWALTEVDPVGVAGACGTVTEAGVTISLDAGGVPGSVVYSAAVSTAQGLTQSMCSLAVPVDVTLDSGHYWLSVQSVGVMWGWQVRSVVSNDEAVWQAPTATFFPDCNSWCGLDTAFGTSSTWDLDFSIQGSVDDPAPDLALTDGAPGSVVSGTQYSYTLVATNTGGSAASGVSVVDSLPGSVHFDSVSTSAGSCVRTAPTSPPKTKGGTVSCAIGALAAGASATVTVTVTATRPGEVSDAAAVTATEVTSADSDDSAAAATAVLGD